MTHGADVQAEIDRVYWYHDFDFPDGLKARTRIPNPDTHRTLWAFIEDQLGAVDLAGKRVLDLGCWDGYWSFLAERRGAREVWATDDATQHTGGAAGLRSRTGCFARACACAPMCRSTTSPACRGASTSS